MIAFTSQLAHIVSSAYIKSPEAVRHNGFSAGSYKDLTRVAKLNETMWTELFLLNRGPLVSEIDEIIAPIPRRSGNEVFTRFFYKKIAGAGQSPAAACVRHHPALSAVTRLHTQSA